MRAWVQSLVLREIKGKCLPTISRQLLFVWELVNYFFMFNWEIHMKKQKVGDSKMADWKHQVWPASPGEQLSQPALTVPLTWLGATGDWGKRHKDRHTKKLGIGWVWHSWWEILVTTSTSKHIYLYSMYGKAGWNSGQGLMDPVAQAAGTVQLWYVVIYYRLSWLGQHVLFFL
jgi:hypothetical protein